MAEKQRTISKKVTLKGHGLHSGVDVEVSFLPGDIDQGYIFRRIDIDVCEISFYKFQATDQIVDHIFLFLGL